MSTLLLSKFFWFRVFLYDDKNPINLLWAEASTVVLIVTLLALFFSRRTMTAYVVSNAILSTLMFSIVVYYTYYGKIMTYQALFQVGQVKDVGESVLTLIKPKFFILFADLAIYMVVRRMLSHQTFTAISFQKKHMALVCVFLLLFSVGKVKAEHTDEILNEKKKAEKMGLISFQVSSLFEDESKKPKWDANSSPERLKVLKGLAADQISNPPQMFGKAAGKNLLLIQLEAFQSFLIGLEVEGREVTPNLNKLVKESIYFPHLFQNIGQGNTSDAEFLANTSLYPVGDSAMSFAFGDREIPSLPRLLKTRGYQTMTFHANKVDFWNRDELYPALGFDRYYDQEYIGVEDIISMGSSDAVLYRKVLPVLEDHQKNKRAFYAQLITMSGHHPFQLPEGHERFPIPEEVQGTMTGDYLQAQHYVDEQLGIFIEEMKKKGLWNNTVVAMYGDHYGLPLDGKNEEEQALLEAGIGHKYSRTDVYGVPFIIHVPGMKEGRKVEITGGQIDMMPTMVNLLGINLDQLNHVHFGKDLLNAKHNLIGERFYLPTGTFINDDILFLPGNRFEDGTAFDVKTGEPVSDFQKYAADYQRAVELIFLSDSYMKTLPKREMEEEKTNP
ncbi:LTA synthase family protein [Brevibacillus dissolubilis]|uniref:LTA synthase family protein n=1 Tax=Brevibacillus dissolubilis TaxID=1844116 RepID=UPI002100673C|nr:LTA synthase family protein [Brevibacillus dissolubilis]